jgi:hypothetical protein
MVAIDFTASNMTPSNPQSLHYMNPNGQQNEYERAIWAVGSILANYDSNQLYPTYGFGGNPSWLGGNVTSHAFALTGREDAPAVQHIQGVLHAYKEALKNTSLAGPTLFAPVI